MKYLKMLDGLMCKGDVVEEEGWEIFYDQISS